MENKNGPSKGTAGIRGKDDERKLFVGGLPKQCTEKDINETFSKFGTIESVNIKKDPMTRASRGFCFIVFSEASVVDTILNSGDITISGKKVEPRKVTKVTIPGKLFIGGLTSDFTEEKLKEHFGQFGTVTEIEWPVDRQKNQKRPYCFLIFENRDTVTELLKKPKQEVCGKELDVKKAKINHDAMWQQGAVAPYGMRGGRGGYMPAYGPAYAYSGYPYDYAGVEYTGYDDYYNGYETYIDTYDAYEAYPVTYAPRAPRGGRTAGGYTRHAPY